ncbi:MAG TPA: hypothetical protein VIM14_03015 [Polyangia bacterium]
MPRLRRCAAAAADEVEQVVAVEAGGGVGAVEDAGGELALLFPNGLDAELRPIGPSQAAAAVALRERLNSQPAEAKVKAQAMDDFDKALATFKSAGCLC